jgi:hypothetical protein
MTWKSIKQNQASRNHTPLNLKKGKAGGTPKADPKEVSQLKLNARNAMRQFAPNPRADAGRFDADSRSLESVPQSGERIGDAASGSAELPASTGEFSSRKNGLDLHNGDVPQGQGSLATVKVGSESAAADTSGEPGAIGYSVKNVARAEIKFPLCDAAVRQIDSGGWALADAIVAECSETGDDGVKNESDALMNAMRDEIAKNRGVELAFERIRKLRKAASAFPPGRRRPAAVSLEGHLEAGTPDVLDKLINSAPSGATLTRNYIRGLKHRAEKVEEDQQKAERRHQVEDQRTALQNICRQLEHAAEEREQQYIALCRSVHKEPEPFWPPLSPENESSLTVAEDLERAIRVLLTIRGFDPKADNIKRAIEEFVRAVLAQQQ